ncbi:MAG: cation diffusion facilitator CzcD-associated flavoprotein CzcO [Myxococcota bacterium]|jgi:cation diffusion facilitator CzcD-associated flavoprotein CzcO
MAEPRLEVAIIGTGFSGIAAAHELRKIGVTDFVLFERSQAIGGTWRDNRYPGCACDVPSHLYSLSWAPNPSWSRVYSAQKEIRQYMERVVDEHGLTPHLQFGKHLTHAAWDTTERHWTLTFADDTTRSARFLILGIGALRDPVIPKLKGLDLYKGTTMHTAQWDPDVSLHGKRIAIVGTGASAIQVLPEIAPIAEHVTVLQRTPPWVKPRGDRAYTRLEHAAFRLPGVLALSRLRTFVMQEAGYAAIFGANRPLNRVARWALTRFARKASGLDNVVPDYDLGCKRVLISDDWYPALALDNVQLLTEPAAGMTETGLTLASGDNLEADVVIWCTGFTVDKPLGDLVIIDKNGDSLSERWGDRPSAYLGITVPDLPNAFTLLGPNTALGHSSVVVMIEAQSRYLAQAIAHARSTDTDLNVTQRAHDAFIAQVDELHTRLVWQSGGCRSWYQSKSGANFTIWPGSSTSYLWATRRFDPSVYAG